MQHPVPRPILPVLAAAVIVAACGTAAPSQPSVQAEFPSASPPLASIEPTSSAQPTADSTPEPIVLGGTWVKPEAGERLTDYTTTLSARPSATGDGATTFTKVVFWAQSAGAEKVRACTTTEPGKGGAWSCKANLLALGAQPGKVTFSFDVHGEGVPAARSPDRSRRVTYAVPPPKPTDVRWKMIAEPDWESGDNTATIRVRWSAPAGYADQFLIYQTWECPRPSTKKNADKPCFVAGTPVDVSMLELLAKTPGDARSIKVHPTVAECAGYVGTILLRARNAYGNSSFAIVEAATVIWVPPGDMIC